MDKIFDAYASYYDLLYKEKNYQKESEYVSKKIKQLRPGAKSILDLGCGTGIHAESFARMGYLVHGVDLSSKMIEQAELRKKALPKEVSDRLTFTQGDIRDLKEGDLYDVVTSLFHVFSYQKSDNDVFCALNSVSRNLTSGGLFLSDCWYGPGVLSQKPGLRVLHLASPEFDVTRIAEPVLDDINNLVDIKYTIFVQEKNTALIQKFEEVHTMRYFFSSEVKRFWSESGFENVCIGKWFDLDKSLDMGDWAALILAQKK